MFCRIPEVADAQSLLLIFLKGNGGSGLLLAVCFLRRRFFVFPAQAALFVFEAAAAGAGVVAARGKRGPRRRRFQALLLRHMASEITHKPVAAAQFGGQVARRFKKPVRDVPQSPGLFFALLNPEFSGFNVVCDISEQGGG